ncbi:hypothetical protein ACH5RR_012378 [Cinchona calisaya]|uniref:Uncharacterized protein n=1 Tax=Cinchona calisaya TaxID=153742 RepID=A0ABD3AA62_9GENT
MNTKQNTSSSAKGKMQKEKNSDLARRARAIVQAVTHYSDPEVLAEVSCGLGEAMVGINLNDVKDLTNASYDWEKTNMWDGYLN